MRLTRNLTFFAVILILSSCSSVQQDLATQSNSTTAQGKHRCIHHDEKSPNLYIWDSNNLGVTSQQLQGEPSAELVSAYQFLLSNADNAMNKGPFSVVFKTKTPPSGNKNDYYSVGPYWWPNPDTEDGLPYIRKDGLVNPERNGQETDSNSFNKFSKAVTALSLAGYLSGNLKYSEKAASLLRTWFLDPATRMNPHLNFGQAIPGITEGRDIGIIDSVKFINIIDSIRLLEYSDVLSSREVEQLKSWFKDYTHWLLTSEHGKSERKRLNNHAVYYDLQVAVFSAFIGDMEEVRSSVESIKERIASQITADGEMPHELDRTQPFIYTAFNLQAFMGAADIAECIGEDLWSFQTENGVGIKTAIDFLAPYAGQIDKWEYEEIKTIDTHPLLWILLRAEGAYETGEYREKSRLYSEKHARSMAWLLYP